MPNINISIKNLPQIKAAFNKAPALMTRNLSIAVRKTVLNVSRQSMINTPVLTGRLRASTYTKFDILKGEVGTNTNYDVYIHDGTKYIAARPYLYDAVEEESHNTDLFFTEAVQETLNEIGNAV